VQAILLFDTSGSVAGAKLEQLRQAARSFLKGLAPEDTATLFAFSYRVRALGAASGKPAAAVSTLARLAAGGTTALFDAVAAAIALADRRDDPCSSCSATGTIA
jgi:secreted protein with Ig-like and vWFA domain